VFILQHGNRCIIQWYEGLDGLGVYTVGFNLGLAMSLAVSAFQTAWLPFFMSFVDKREEAKVLFGRVLTYYVLGFGVITVFFFIFAKPLVMVLTQPAFHEGYKVVGLSASAQFFGGAFCVLLPCLYFAKEVAYVSLIQALAAIAGVGLNFVLIPAYGLSGAAMAVALGFLGMALLMHLWNFHRRGRYLHVHYEWKRVTGLGAVYSIYAGIMALHRDLSLLGELMFSIAVMLTLPLPLFCFLHPAERRVARSLLPNLATKRTISTSP
jgi:O-antigen/teichoic acid export membrane protein